MTDRTFDVTALGELLVDLTECGAGEGGTPLFEANPGGAPANVLTMLRRLGRSCAFLGKVGRDSFGDMLERALAETGVDVRGLLRDEKVPTTLAVVHTLPGGDRDFHFYRRPGADLTLRAGELDRPALEHCRIFHFGSLSLTDEPCRSAARRAVDLAQKSGALLSFDPNLRLPLWDSPADAREQIAWGLGCCDILKIADDELEFMTGESDPDAGTAALRRDYPRIRLLCVTMGARGSVCWYGGERIFEPALSLGGVIDTTGAGDTFCACVLDTVLRYGLEEMSARRRREMLRFANAAAYLVTTRRGALRSMPERKEVERLLTPVRDGRKSEGNDRECEKNGCADGQSRL